MYWPCQIYQYGRRGTAPTCVLRNAPVFSLDACLWDGQNAKRAFGSRSKFSQLCLFIYNRNITGGAANRFDPVSVGVPILLWSLPGQGGGCVLDVSPYGTHSIGLCRHKDRTFEGAPMTTHLKSPSILFSINVLKYQCTQIKMTNDTIKNYK